LRCKTCGAPHVIKHDPVSGYWVHPVTDWGTVHVGVPTQWLVVGAVTAAVMGLVILYMATRKVQTVVQESGLEARAQAMVELWLERSAGSLSLLRHRYCAAASMSDLEQWQDSTILNVEGFSGTDAAWSGKVISAAKGSEDRATVTAQLTRCWVSEAREAHLSTSNHRAVLKWVRCDGEWYFDPIASRGAK